MAKISDLFKKIENTPFYVITDEDGEESSGEFFDSKEKAEDYLKRLKLEDPRWFESHEVRGPFVIDLDKPDPLPVKPYRGEEIKP